MLKSNKKLLAVAIASLLSTSAFADNKVEISQVGSELTSTATQIGDFNIADVKQTGTLNEISINMAQQLLRIIPVIQHILSKVTKVTLP